MCPLVAMSCKKTNGEKCVHPGLGCQLHRNLNRIHSKYVDCVTAPSALTLNVLLDDGFFKNSEKKVIANATDFDIDAVKKIPDMPEIPLIYILYLLNTTASYFFVYKKSILITDQKSYIPCAFGMVFARIIYWMEKINWLDGLNRFFALCGQATIPIMFMHIPLNHWKDAFEYGRVMYVVIGIGIPIVFTLIFNKYKAMRKLFGLPKL